MELDGFIGSERGSVSNSEIRREGSIFIRIDGRLDVRRTEPELWKNLRAQVEGSVDQHPGSPVFIDLRQVSHADAPSIQALVAAVSDAKERTSLTFLGPGPGLEELLASTSIPGLEPLLMFAPWEADAIMSDEDTNPSFAPIDPDAEKNASGDAASKGVTDAVDKALAKIPGMIEGVSGEMAKPAPPVPEESAFEIHLDLEKQYIDSGSDARDHLELDHAGDGFDFTESWTSVVETPVAPPTPPAPLRRKTPQEASPQTKAVDRLLRSTPETPVQEPSEPSRESAPAGTADEQRLLSLLSHLDHRTRELEGREAENEKHIAALEAQLAEQKQLTEEREAWANRKEQAREPLPQQDEQWLDGASLGATEAAFLREQWQRLLGRFSGRGIVDPEEIRVLASHVDSLGSGIGANLGRVLDQETRGSVDNHWGALMLLTSTLVREKASSARRKMSLAAAILASLVEHAPGLRPEPGVASAELEDHVVRLFRSRFCEVDESFDENRVCLDLGVWRAGLHLTRGDRLTPKSWGKALASLLSVLTPDDPACHGLPRIIESHSVYLPGSWVELSTGEIGQVIGGSRVRSELPKVLVLFEKSVSSVRPVSPRLFPRIDESRTTVTRILDQSPKPTAGVAPYGDDPYGDGL